MSEKNEGMLGEKQSLKVEQTSEGVFLGKSLLYNPDVIKQRDPFVEEIAPGLVDNANRFVQEHPDQAGFARDSVRRLGLNPDLVSLNINEFPTPEELIENKRG